MPAGHGKFKSSILFVLLALWVVAVVSYPKEGRTFSVEFYSCDSRYMDANLMKKTLAGFTVKNGKDLSLARIGLAGLLRIAFVRFRPGR